MSTHDQSNKDRPANEDLGNGDEFIDDAAVDADGAANDETGADAAPTLSPLEVAQGRVQELEDRLRRTEAEFVNETKRIRKNADNQGRFAIERVILDLLPMVDALHGARRNVTDDDAGRSHSEGLTLIERQLADALSRHGVERIEALGLPFDPAVHEAMMVVEDDSHPAQTVRDEMRAGFTLNGRVVRPAQVIVAKPSSAAPATEGTDAESGDA